MTCRLRDGDQCVSKVTIASKVSRMQMLTVNVRESGKTLWVLTFALLADAYENEIVTLVIN